jgi:WhiB family transcriptional regulator, redox-sensing transcriptional regulator
MSTGKDSSAGLLARLARLRRLRHVPDAVLAAIVARDGLIRRPLHGQPAPAVAGSAEADRELAAGLCVGCPVLDECLELDLRWMADRTTGAFAGLTEADRRALYPLWAEQRHEGQATGTRPAGSTDEAER